MATSVIKGQAAQISYRFKNLNNADFLSAPTWTLYDWDGDVLQTGVATGAGRTWTATFTIPVSLIVPDGEAELELEFKGETETDHLRATKEIILVDVDDTWREFGLLWHSSRTNLHDRIYYQIEPSSIVVELREGYGEGKVVAETEYANPDAISLTSMGYVYEVGVSGLTLEKMSTGGYLPYQLTIIATFAGTDIPDIVVKPVYVATPTMISQINSLKRYLDKARLDELDKNLGWGDEELAHFLQQGMLFINSYQPEVTWWTVETCPSPLLSPLQKAAAMEALNARYLAEGFNAFDFQGATTQLQVDRTQHISYKIDELKGILEASLERMKRAAISSVGKGTPPPGVTGGRKTIGALGIHNSPVVNYSYPLYGKRFGRNF